jgi:hypothetical protein
MRRGFDPDEKPKALDFDQKISVAWAYFVQGVAEACKAVRLALEPDKEVP